MVARLLQALSNGKIQSFLYSLHGYSGPKIGGFFYALHGYAQSRPARKLRNAFWRKGLRRFRSCPQRENAPCRNRAESETPFRKCLAPIARHGVARGDEALDVGEPSSTGAGCTLPRADTDHLDREAGAHNLVSLAELRPALPGLTAPPSMPGWARSTACPVRGGRPARHQRGRAASRHPRRGSAALARFHAIDRSRAPGRAWTESDV